MGSNLAAQEVSNIDIEADHEFGRTLDFSLKVTDSDDIEALTLFFRPELSTNTYQVNVPFEPGNVISLTQSVAVGEIDLPPFSHVDYFWELQSQSEVINSEERRFIYDDDRINWQTMTRDQATAHWVGDGSPVLGQSILDVVSMSMERLLTIVPIADMAPFDVYVYPSSADLRLTIGEADLSTLQQEQLALGVLLVTAVNAQTMISDVTQSIPYELAHLILYRAAGSQFDSLPWWLVEGISVNARQLSSQRDQAVLAAAIDSGETIPLWRLCTEPQGTADRLELASIQSASLVDFLLKSQPEDAMSRLVSSSLAGYDCEEMVRRELGFTLDSLEDAWLANFDMTPAAQSRFNDFALWLALLTGASLLTVLLLRVTRLPGSKS